MQQPSPSKRTAGELQLREQACREGAPQLRFGQLRRKLLPLFQHALRACVPTRWSYHRILTARVIAFEEFAREMSSYTMGGAHVRTTCPRDAAAALSMYKHDIAWPVPQLQLEQSVA